MGGSCESDIVITPRRNKNEKKIPEEGILLVNPTEADFETELLVQRGAETRFLFNSKLCLSSEEKFVAGPAIGAPMAALTLEKLIALGAKRIILFGWCGAIDEELKIGDVVVPDAAISGEGTSQYYLEENMQPEVHSSLRIKLLHLLQDNNVSVKGGCVWSTDAIYREKRSYLKALHREKNVVAVDMEFSALCSVAAFREVEFAAVLVVSDEIWAKSWRPGFSDKQFRQNAAKMRRLLIDNRFSG